MLRKIMTREEKEHGERRKKIIISAILAAIMLFSTAGYFIFDFSGGKTGKVMHKDIEFKQTEYGRWAFSMSGYDFETAYNPLETENTTLATSKTLSTYSNQPLYLASYSPADYDIPSFASQEILRNINRFIARSNPACLSEEECSQNYPIKNCSADNIIIFKRAEKGSNISRITDMEKCAVIEYDSAISGEEERAADAFLFRILGI